MEFIAIDVETANHDIASICQVGMARYSGGQLTHEWKSYVDPEDYFHQINISIHGITEETVKGAPNFKEVNKTITEALNGKIVVCHTHFDRVSICRAFKRQNLPDIYCSWLDSAKVARRAWSDEFSQSGYGLANVCDFLGYEFGHHDALEDAKAAGHIMLSAVRDTGIRVSEWRERTLKPIHEIKREGYVSGPLHGETIVFTGTLQIPRHEAADIAAKGGCSVGTGVTKKTTIVVVGDQDIGRLAGAEKSSKHRKAEELISKGHAIRIIGESDFMEVMGTAS